MAKSLSVFCLVATFSVSGISQVQAEITLRDAQECCKIIGDFGSVIPVAGSLFYGAQKAGLLPDEEREFRERVIKQNERIISALTDLQSGITNIDQSLGRVETKIEQLPSRIEGQKLYIDAFTILKRLARHQGGRDATLDTIKVDLQRTLDRAEAAATLAPADLYYHAGASMLGVSLAKCFSLESTDRDLPQEASTYYTHTVTAMDRVLAHCEKTFDLLANQEKLHDEYEATVVRINANLKKYGLSTPDEKNGLIAASGLRYTRKIESSGIRFVIVRTKEKKDVEVTETVYASSGPIWDRLIGSSGNPDTTLYFYRDIARSSFREVPASGIASRQTVSYADVAQAPEASLLAAIEEHNRLAESNRIYAFRLALSGQFAEWIARSKESQETLRTALRKRASK